MKRNTDRLQRVTPADARVHPTALLGERVEIGSGTALAAYCVVGDDVRVGRDCRLAEHAIVRAGTTLGRGSTIDSFAVVGGDPPGSHFDTGVRTQVVLGELVVVREGVTIHRSTDPAKPTRIEDGVLLMANAHVAHDCEVGEHAVLANNVMLGGHVEVGAHAVLGGGAGIHQFVRIGESAMVGGNAAICLDVPPFTLVAERNQLFGLNVVGMRRRGFAIADIADLKECFRRVFADGGDPRANARAVLAEGEVGTSPIGVRFLAFFVIGDRGVVRLRRGRG